MRDYKYEAAATLDYEAARANASLLLASNNTLPCPARSFNHSQHQHTFVTEVNGATNYFPVCNLLTFPKFIKDIMHISFYFRCCL